MCVNKCVKEGWTLDPHSAHGIGNSLDSQALLSMLLSMLALSVVAE